MMFPAVVVISSVVGVMLSLDWCGAASKSIDGQTGT